MAALDDVVERATAGGVSAKYGKKVRRKLQQHLNALRGIEPPEAVAAAAAAAAEAEAEAARLQEEKRQAAAAAAAAAAKAAAEAQQARQAAILVRQQQQAAAQQNGHGGQRSPAAPASPAVQRKLPAGKPAAPAAKPPPPGFAPAQPPARAPASPAKAAYNPLATAQQRKPAPAAPAAQPAAAAPQAMPRPAWGQAAPAVQHQHQQHQHQQHQQQYSGAGGGSLFSAPPVQAPASLFSATAAAAHQQQPLLPSGAPGASLFAQGPPSGAASSSLFASHRERSIGGPPMAQQPGFASLAAFSSGGMGHADASSAPPASSAPLSSQFADLDIGELQQAGYESFAAEMPHRGGAAAAGGLLSADLAAAVFGASGGAPPVSLGEHVLQLHHHVGDAGGPSEPLEAGAQLLSRDLLGEIDGMQPGAAPLLRLPDSVDSLFAPAAPPAGAPPASAASTNFSAFRSLW